MDHETQELIAKFARLDALGRSRVLGFITGYLAMMERVSATGEAPTRKRLRLTGAAPYEGGRGRAA